MKKSSLNWFKRNWGQLLLLLIVFYFLFVFLIYPNLNVITKAFYKDGKFTFDSVNKVIASKRARRGLKNSILLAVTLSITVNIIGVFIVLVTEYFEIKGSKFLKIGFLSTLIYGGIVLVSGYIFSYGEHGILTKLVQTFIPSYKTNWFSGYIGVVFVMTFSITSNHMIFLRNALKKVDNHTIEASKNLGDNTFGTLRKVVLPILKPTIFAVTILVFLTGLGAYAAPLLIGGRDFETLNPLIKDLVLTSPDISIVLSVILGLLVVGLLVLFTKMERSNVYYSTSKTQGEFVKQKINNKWANAIVHIIAYILCFIYIVPILIIILFSFTNLETIASGKITLSSFTLKNYIEVLSDINILRPFLNSINFSIIAALIVVFFVFFMILIKFKSKLKSAKSIQYILLIPWLLPSTVIAMGLIQTFNVRSPLVLNKILTGTTLILILGYVIIKIPFTYRILNAIYYTVDESYENASKSLGASKLYTFRRVTLPTVFPTILALVAINFNSLITDYNMTVFLYHPRFKTLGIDIKQKTDLMAGGNAQVVLLVYTVLLMVISSAILYVAYGRLLKKVEI